MKLAAYDLGILLGLASWQFSINDAAAAGLNLRKAEAGPMAALVRNHVQDAHFDQVVNLGQLEQARQVVSGYIGRVSPMWHDIYQFALHMGLARGQSFTPQNHWLDGANLLCQDALNQARNDLKTYQNLGFMKDFEPTIRGIAYMISQVVSEVHGEIESVVYSARNRIEIEPFP